MCSLYAMTTAPDAVRKLFAIRGGSLVNIPPLTNIRPTNDAPVVRLAATGEREVALLRWGFVLPQAGKAPKPVINARSDTVSVSSFWRASFQQRRCLVPVTRFCEWSEMPPKRQHWFTVPGADTIAFAGLWTTWRGVLKEQPVVLETFAFLTCPPNAVVAPIHPKAMPVILDPNDYDAWLHGTPQQALALAKPFAAERMGIDPT
jgi:putative SOS response-associated peptidase YedK